MIKKDSIDDFTNNNFLIPKWCKMDSSRTILCDPILKQNIHSRNTFFNHLFQLKKVVREMNIEISEF